MKLKCVAVCLCFVSLCVCATSVSAQNSIFYLWGDEEKVRCDIFLSGPYIPFDVYVFLIPGAEGAFAAEYKFPGLPNHFMTGYELGPFASGATLGSPFGSPGFSVSFIMCMTKTFLVCKVECMAADLNPGYYTLEPHEETQFFGVAICSGSRPMEEALLYGQFGYNANGWCRFGTEESSWGAIKEMYR